VIKENLKAKVPVLVRMLSFTEDAKNFAEENLGVKSDNV